MVLKRLFGNSAIAFAALGTSLGFSAARMPHKLSVVVRQDLDMSAGKLAAQVGHAVHDAVRAASEKALRRWEDDGSMIVVLQVDCEADLKRLLEEANKLGIPTHDQYDEGLTEVDDDTFTVLGVGPGESPMIDQVTGKLQLYMDSSARRAAALEKEASQLRQQLADAEAALAQLRAGKEL
eukprot:TRINITY_DN96128_c0_g1_i1.p1 TRINITY_DN96128_c0_g1~~TRINITY_DN96128_c0_g1_i1.p1  ORF type:complete len:180 (+),score=54.58 TRINITY_DN96128_c0_g1_i1:35-574(+)